MILVVHVNPAIDRVYAVERLTIGGVARPYALTANAGGKGSNVSRVARLLGEEVSVCGFIGGYAGDFVEGELKKNGIRTAFTRIKGESRSCINIFDKSSRLSTEILEPGPHIASDEQEAFVNRYEALLDRCRLVSASGSLANGLESDFFNVLIERAKEKGIPFILDTSGDALRKSLEAAPYLIKPNTEEISDYLGTSSASLESLVDCLTDFRKGGIRLPVVSMGSKGCLTIIDNEVCHFSHPRLEAKNAVGSGDSFIAGFSVGLARNLSDTESIRLGIACGMANTQFFKTGHITTELVEKYLPLIHYDVV